jgi:hypothetical protein
MLYSFPANGKEVDSKDGLTPSPVNDHYIEAVLIAFFMQKILDLSWRIRNDNLFHFKTKPPLV